VWKGRRENPDTCVTAITYPKDFLYTYKTTFENKAGGDVIRGKGHEEVREFSSQNATWFAFRVPESGRRTLRRFPEERPDIATDSPAG
jgi:hypothetical protein